MDCVSAACFVLLCFVFFNQKTAYEMRISDWSSDVCLPIYMDRLPELAAAGALSVDTDITLIDGDHSSRLVDVILIAQEAAGRVLLSLELLSVHRQVIV